MTGSLGHVRGLLGKTSVAFAKEIKAVIKAGDDLGHEEMSVKASRFADIDPENRELNGILSTAMTQTRWLDSRPIKKHLAKGGFDFAQLKKKPTTVYMIIPATKIHRNKALLRIWTTAIMTRLMQDVRRAEVPVLLALDEAATLGHLPIIHENLPLMREYNVKMWSFYQDLALARMSLGRDRVDSFTANSGVLHAFAPQDFETAKMLSVRSGERKTELLSYSAPVNERTGLPHGGTLKYEEAKLPGMLPQTLMNMDPGYSVLYTHKTKEVVRSFFPDPAQMPAFAKYASIQPEELDATA